MQGQLGDMPQHGSEVAQVSRPRHRCACRSITSSSFFCCTYLILAHAGTLSALHFDIAEQSTHHLLPPPGGAKLCLLLLMCKCWLSEALPSLHLNGNLSHGLSPLTTKEISDWGGYGGACS